MDQASALTDRARCKREAGEFRLDPGGYVAISHVWEEGCQDLGI